MMEITESTDQLLKRRPAQASWFSRFQVVALVILTLVAVIGKFYLPRLIPNTEWLELPLLITIYFGLMRHSQIQALLFGAFVGLAEDSLSPANLHPIGMYGISKTLVGYFAASVIRATLCFFFNCFHAFFYWIMRRALLGQVVPFDLQDTLVHAALNAVIAIPLFLVLDRMKVSAS
jgi:rod shape-determining protein MreD